MVSHLFKSIWTFQGQPCNIMKKKTDSIYFMRKMRAAGNVKGTWSLPSMRFLGE